MKDNNKATRPPAEVVFVLRVRAGANGWWGQIRRVDQPQVHYVRDLSAITTLLQQHWDAQHSVECIESGSANTSLNIVSLNDMLEADDQDTTGIPSQ